MRGKESEQEESYLRSTDTRQGFWGSLALMQCTYRVDLDCITISYCHEHDSVSVTLIRFISDRWIMYVYFWCCVANEVSHLMVSCNKLKFLSCQSVFLCLCVCVCVSVCLAGMKTVNL